MANPILSIYESDLGADWKTEHVVVENDVNGGQLQNRDLFRTIKRALTVMDFRLERPYIDLYLMFMP